MRIICALVLSSVVVAGCTPSIPVRPEFDVSALRAEGGIPPEFAAFNRYDPRVNPLLADQICATPLKVQVVKALAAVPGEIQSQQTRCVTYQAFERLYGQVPTP
jgi:hypothetical protein